MLKQKMKDKFNKIKKELYLLQLMVRRNIKTQYRNSVLGVLWTVLNPLLNMIVIAFVFSSLFNRYMPSGADYPVYLLCGNIIFNLMRMSTTESLPSIVNHFDMLTKTKVPAYIFPTSNLFSALVNFGFSFLALIGVMLIRIPNGVTFHWTIFLFPITVLPALLLFSAGMSYILCTFYVYFRDIKHFYSVIISLWTYCTPLFYDISMLSPKVQTVLRFNPMFYFVDYFRSLVMYGIIPSAKDTIIMFAFGIVFFVAGILIFNSQKKKFVLNI